MVVRPAANTTPFPETAFTGDATESERPTPTIDRFATRRISSEEPSTLAPHFRGARVDLDLKSTDLHDVFRLLADVGKVNVVVAGDVSGTITMRLRHVPWDQAMDVIAKARGLVYEREGNVILVRLANAKK